MLNSLKEKYEKSGLEIISIYPLDKEEDILKMNTRFDVLYAFNKITLTTLDELKQFNVNGYPTFYILDTESKVIKGFSGYSEDIGKEVENLIQRSIKKP